MRRISPLLLILLLLPAGASAARSATSFSFAQSLVAASSSPGNAYAGGATVVLTAPVGGDFSGFGGTVVTAAPITGDTTLAAGSINSRASVGGDMRAFAGTISVNGPVGGDLVAVGYSVTSLAPVGGSVFVTAANTTLRGGASGPVTIYSNNIVLGGDYADDVHIVASGRVALAASTTIRGALFYEAPELASIPSSVTVTGGVHYTNASYLPDVGTSRILTLLSVGFFLFVRVLGALLLAGLLAGFFPGLSEEIAERAYGGRVRSILLTTLLGFAIFVATPILFVLLLLTFVGIGLAFLLLVSYALLAILAVLFAGILLGTFFARRVAGRHTVRWSDGALGMLALSAISLIPVIGLPVVLLLTLFSAGALLQIFFHFAFPREQTPELL